MSTLGGERGGATTTKDHEVLKLYGYQLNWGEHFLKIFISLCEIIDQRCQDIADQCCKLS